MIRWVAEATQGKGEVPAFVATAYRGYYNRHWPKNLSPKVLAQKAANLLPYGGNEAWKLAGTRAAAATTTWASAGR